MSRFVEAPNLISRRLFLQNSVSFLVFPILPRRDNKFPLPPPIEYQRYDGSTGILTIPHHYWPILVESHFSTGTNRHLLAAIAQFESEFNPNAVNSESGAAGMFQFMPDTWLEYRLQPTDLATNARASALAAGSMLQIIGVAPIFDQALGAFSAGRAEDFRLHRQHFIDSFSGQDGSPSWCQDPILAESVFTTAINLHLASRPANPTP